MKEQQVQVRTPDGTADAVLVRTDENAAQPGVIVLTDIYGVRPEFVDLAKRIAEQGYAVLVPNIFYRIAKPPLFDFKPDFQDDRTKKRVGELTRPLTLAAMERDGAAYVDWLSSQPFVNRAPVGVVGFCFSGRFALATAAARPERVAAAASFHGGGLFTDNVDSPHLVLPRVKAALYFGHATNDHSMTAELIEKFEWALRSWGGEYQSEVYPARHGWMIAGGGAYDAANAERGFRKMMDVFHESLHSAVSP